MHEQLQDLFDGVRLTPAQRRIAQCILEQGAAAAYLSSGELAALARVSQPSVTRFATALGHAGYPELRRAVRTAVGAPTNEPDPLVRNEFQAAVAGEVTGLETLAGLLADGAPQRAAVADAAKLLAASRPLPVVGLRAAGPLAGYFGYFAGKVHPDVRVLTEGGSLLGDRLEQARAAGATAMLGIVLPRY
ncbi:MAG TPA: transcriptional regulator, partial [Rugosimonospora sp.]|nr:transcriptional regulator [Rugosimonospora sp.]